jgi:hypothetical protein
MYYCGEVIFSTNQTHGLVSSDELQHIGGRELLEIVFVVSSEIFTITHKTPVKARKGLVTQTPRC